MSVTMLAGKDFKQRRGKCAQPLLPSLCRGGIFFIFFFNVFLGRKRRLDAQGVF